MSLLFVRAYFFATAEKNFFLAPLFTTLFLDTTAETLIYVALAPDSYKARRAGACHHHDVT